MNRNLLRTTATLLVGGYVLTVTVSGMFHTHGRHIRQSRASDNGELGHESSCWGYDHHTAVDRSCSSFPPGGQRGESELFGTHSLADDCPVCSFLAQKPIPATPVREVACADLPEPLVRVKALARIEEPLSLIWIRGPPSVA